MRKSVKIVVWLLYNKYSYEFIKVVVVFVGLYSVIYGLVGRSYS